MSDEKKSYSPGGDDGKVPSDAGAKDQEAKVAETKGSKTASTAKAAGPVKKGKAPRAEPVTPEDAARHRGHGGQYIAIGGGKRAPAS